MIIPEVLIDGREFPRIARTIPIFGDAAPGSGNPIVYDTVASGVTYSDWVDMVAFNNIGLEANGIMGSGTAAIDIYNIKTILDFKCCLHNFIFGVAEQLNGNRRF